MSALQQPDTPIPPEPEVADLIRRLAAIQVGPPPLPLAPALPLAPPLPLVPPPALPAAPPALPAAPLLPPPALPAAPLLPPPAPRNERFYIATNDGKRARHMYKFGAVMTGTLRGRESQYHCGYVPDEWNRYVFIAEVTNARAVEDVVRELVGAYAVHPGTDTVCVPWAVLREVAVRAVALSNRVADESVALRAWTDARVGALTDADYGAAPFPEYIPAEVYAHAERQPAAPRDVWPAEMRAPAEMRPRARPSAPKALLTCPYCGHPYQIQKWFDLHITFGCRRLPR